MARIINGKLIAKRILKEALVDVEKINKIGKKICLAVVVVGFDYASQVYVKNKKKVCEELNVNLRTIQLSEVVSQTELDLVIKKLNGDESINGIIVQLPLPAHLSVLRICNLISPNKDVDGFCRFSAGSLFLNSPGFRPCTPAGIIKMLEFEEVGLESKNCIVIGKSNMVGKPLALMLLEKGATVTVCSSKTLNLKDFTMVADVIFSAVGRINLIKADMVKEGVVVVDIGINRLGSGKICGDVDFVNVSEKASLITPVPGGVGPLTVAMLARNVVLAAKLQYGL